MSPSFQHSGVLIRPITPEDKPSLFAAVRESIDTVGCWMSWCHPDYSTNDADQWIALCQSNWQSGIDREFGIFDAASGEVLGCVGLNQINRINNFGNLGYWVRASRTGEGVAATAAMMAARFAFGELKLSRVEVIACLDNVASRRVAEKIGGHFEGVARSRLQFKGVPCDAAVYSLLPNDIVQPGLNPGRFALWTLRDKAAQRRSPLRGAPYPMSQSPILNPPVRGQWAIMNPPGHAKLAFDFLAVDEQKSPYGGASLLCHIFSTIPVTSTLAWEKPVFAVMDATVIAASDGTPDRENICMSGDLFRLMFFGPKLVAPFSALGGNYVILKCGDFYPLYAHLKNGSVCVQPGDLVCSGDQLGVVGNSGSSLQPHLHFQVMNTPDPFPLFKNLVPFALSSAQRRTKEKWELFVNGAVRNGDHLRL